MTTEAVRWPQPSDLLTWFGTENVVNDTQEQSTATAVLSEAIGAAYLDWYQEKLTLESQLLQAQQEVMECKGRCDRLIDGNGTRHVSADGSNQVLVVQKVKPHEPARFDGSQDLEVVTHFLDDVEHYVRQGGAVCPKASKDNQNIDTLWRFLSTRIFRWFEDAMRKRGVETIPPRDGDYGVTWKSIRTSFRKQYVPESAITVIRKEWHALRYNRNQVLKFNRRALELITILGGSLTITRDNSLWEEYLQKLPEGTANDVSQQARLMSVLKDIQLTLSGMMDIVAERALPFLLTGSFDNTAPHATNASSSAGAHHHHDPMDLTNLEEHLNVIYENTKCYRCGGTGHVARQCPSPNPSNRQMPPKSRQPQPPTGRGSGSGKYNQRPSSQQPTRQQQPVQQQSVWRQETGQHRQSNWRRPERQPGRQQVNTVTDDHEPPSGMYNEGGWGDEGNDLGEERGTEDSGEQLEPDCGHCGVSGRDAGKDKQ